MKTIVLADGQPEIRTLLREALDDPAYRLLEASSAPVAIEMARKERADLLLLDWRPGMSGLEVINTLRADGRSANLPILLLTPRVQERNRLTALGLGESAFLSQPFRPIDFLDNVRRALGDTCIESTVSSLPRTAKALRRLRTSVDDRMRRHSGEVGQERNAESRREMAIAVEIDRALNALKAEFLAFASHELRTPLQAMAMVELLNPHGLSTEQDEIVELVRSGYGQLKSFVERSLEYFDWIASDHRRACIAIDVSEVVRRACDDCKSIRQPDVDLRLDAAPDMRALFGDPKHLVAIVDALLDNAVKFSRRRKQIIVRVRRDGDYIVLSVTDSGVGLSRPRLRELFKPYSVGDVIHRPSGSGLSLAIADAVIRAHGGRIRAESDGPGHGTTVLVELQSPPAQESFARRPPQEDDAGEGTT